jgi:hypothetical protein
MHAVQAVRGAERDEVRGIVAPAARAEQPGARAPPAGSSPGPGKVRSRSITRSCGVARDASCSCQVSMKCCATRTRHSCGESQCPSAPSGRRGTRLGRARRSLRVAQRRARSAQHLLLLVRVELAPGAGRRWSPRPGRSAAGRSRRSLPSRRASPAHTVPRPVPPRRRAAPACRGARPMGRARRPPRHADEDGRPPRAAASAERSRRQASWANPRAPPHASPPAHRAALTGYTRSHSLFAEQTNFGSALPALPTSPEAGGGSGGTT